jgi:allantoinase
MNQSDESDRRSSPLYDYWPITERPELRWPDGKRIAVYIALNIEHFRLGQISTSRTMVTAPLPVDPLNHGWRDYGTRVGFWRSLRLFDEYELPVSALINAEAMTMYPQIVAAGLERNWSWVGHGVSNSQFWTGMDREQEREALAGIVSTFEAATGRRPRGWLGPALTETRHTPELLAELGFSYTLDWACDDQPFPVHTGGGRFISVPYALELNDITLFLDQSTTATGWRQLICDQFDTLREEAELWPSPVMCISLHPFIAGHALRYRQLAETFRYLREHNDVWFCTSDDIADWYLEHCYDAALAQAPAAGQRR